MVGVNQTSTLTAKGANLEGFFTRFFTGSAKDSNRTLGKKTFHSTAIKMTRLRQKVQCVAINLCH